jgi:predicted amino acid dehydrogenase
LRLEPSAYVSQPLIQRLLAALQDVCAALSANDTYVLLRHLVKDAPPREIARRYCHDDTRDAARHAPERAVGFIGYFVDPEDVKGWDPSLAEFTAAQIEELLDAFFPLLDPVRTRTDVITTPARQSVAVKTYGLPITSQMFKSLAERGEADLIDAKLRDAVQMAGDDDCAIVGFAGMTSIVTNSCLKIRNDRVAVTSGNSLTVASCVDAVREAAEANAIDLANCTVAVIGSSGNIGSILAAMIAGDIGKLILIGRSVASLQSAVQQIVGQLSDAGPGDRAMNGVVRTLCDLASGARVADSRYLEVTSDLRAAVRADVIITATNESGPVLFPEHVGRHPTLILDVAVPPNVDPGVTHQRPQARVLTTGRVGLGPMNAGFHLIGTSVKAGAVYACAAETILLGLEDRRADYSCGPINVKQVKEIAGLMQRHGFSFRTAGRE